MLAKQLAVRFTCVATSNIHVSCVVLKNKHYDTSNSAIVFSRVELGNIY